MNSLREAVDEYLTMRRGLGFKLTDAGKGLLDFVAFMEKNHASYITRQLALAWAQQPSTAQPSHRAQRLSFVRGFARYRSATVNGKYFFPLSRKIVFPTGPMATPSFRFHLCEGASMSETPPEACST